MYVKNKRIKHKTQIAYLKIGQHNSTITPPHLPPQPTQACDESMFCHLVVNKNHGAGRLKFKI